MIENLPPKIKKSALERVNNFINIHNFSIAEEKKKNNQDNLIKKSTQNVMT